MATKEKPRCNMCRVEDCERYRTKELGECLRCTKCGHHFGTIKTSDKK